MKTVVGISYDYSDIGNEKIEINPYIFEDLDYAKGSVNTTHGKISVEWHKNGDKADIKVIVPNDVKSYFKGSVLNPGLNELSI